MVARKPKAPQSIDDILDISWLLSNPYGQTWWRRLPYGFWYETTGATVCFDRDYCPLCRLLPNGTVELLSPWHWIDIICQESQPSEPQNACLETLANFLEIVDSRGGYFYQDGPSHPGRSLKKLRQLEQISQKFGIAQEVERRWQLPQSDFPSVLKRLERARSDYKGAD